MAFILRTGPRNLPAAGDTIYVYNTGTTDLVTGLTKPDTARTPLTNPFTVTEGQWGFEPPDSGRVDVYWQEESQNLISDVNLRDSNLDHAGPTKVIFADVNRADTYLEDGSIEKPFKAFAAAVAIATSGDTIKCTPGTYAGDTVLPAGVSVEGWGSNKVIFTGSLTTGTGVPLSLKNIQLQGPLVIKAPVKLDDCYCANNVHIHPDAGASTIQFDHSNIVPAAGIVPLTLNATGTVHFFTATIAAVGDVDTITQTGGQLITNICKITGARATEIYKPTGGSCSFVATQIYNTSIGNPAVDLSGNGAIATNPNGVSDVIVVGNFSCGAKPTLVEGIQFPVAGALSGTALTFRPSDKISDNSTAGGPTVKDSLNSLLSGVTSGVIQDILDRYFIPEGYSGRPKKVLSLSASRAYYFNAICNENPIFSPNGVNFYYYVSTFGDGAGGSMAFSNDGINWVNEIPMAGLTGDGYHAALSYDGVNIHIHYWTGTMNYTIGNVHHAVSSPGLAHAFSGDAAITEVVPGQILTGSGGTGYRRGTYGPSQMNYNPTATNTGTDPRNYTFWGVLGVTDGSKESSILIYSVDGVAFKRWDGRGDIAILPATAGTFYSYSTNQFFPYYDTDLKMWIAYFQGCSSNPNNQNVGLAHSLDLLTEFTVFNYPLYAKGAAEYGERCYCPCLIQTCDDGLVLYKAGRSLAGVYGTYVSTSLIAHRTIPLLDRGKASEAINDSLTVDGTMVSDALDTLKEGVGQRYTHIVTAGNISAKKIVFAGLGKPDPLNSTDFIAGYTTGPLTVGVDFILSLGATLEFNFDGYTLDGILVAGQAISFSYAY